MAWLADSLLAAWKFLRSFVTRDWNLEDYPVRVEYFPDVLRRWVVDGHPLRTEYHSNVVERQVRCPPRSIETRAATARTREAGWCCASYEVRALR